MKKALKQKVIFLAGGGTGGPVAPLLALAEEIQSRFPNSNIYLIGDGNGPERRLAEKHHIPFFAITKAKLTRYWSYHNVFLPVTLLTAFIQSVRLCYRYQPSVVIGAGGYSQVPLMYAAKMFGANLHIHQQDFDPSLSNVLAAPITSSVSSVFLESQNRFSHTSLESLHKFHHTGNPVRACIRRTDQKEAKRKLGFDPERPVVVVVGGGTGAMGLNAFVGRTLAKITIFSQVFHVTGQGKSIEFTAPGYTTVEFFDDMGLLFSAADVVISRAGLGTISELSELKIPTILVPLPDTHQEENAYYLWKKKAALALDQNHTTDETFIAELKKLLYSSTLTKQLSENIHSIMPHGAREKIVSIIFREE